MVNGFDMTAANVGRMNLFLAVAAGEGLEDAMKQLGDLVSLEEAAALEKLKPDEIKVLWEISENILHYGKSEWHI